MQINIFTLCDSVQVYDGKMIVVGAQSRFLTNKLPLKMPSITLAIRLSYGEEESGEKNYSIFIESPSGKPLAPPIKQTLNVKKEIGNMSTVDICIGLNNMPIEEAGYYTIKLIENDTEYTSKFTIALKQ